MKTEINYRNTIITVYPESESDISACRMLSERLEENSMKERDIVNWCFVRQLCFDIKYKYRKEYGVRLNFLGFLLYRDAVLEIKIKKNRGAIGRPS